MTARLILVSLILFPALAGCFSASPDPCFQIPWPASGFTAEYLLSIENRTGDADTRMPIRFGDVETISRGDGREVAALVVDDGGTSFVQLDGLHVSGTKGGGHSFDLNHALKHRGIPLMGECVESDTEMEIPYKSPSNALTIRVLQADSSALTIEMTTPGTGPDIDNNRDAGNRYILEWTERTPLASKVLVYTKDSVGWRHATTLTLTNTAGSFAARPVVNPAPPFEFDTPRSDPPCWHSTNRHPDLTPLPAMVSFATYMKNTSSDESLRDYLVTNPEACAVLVSYEIVDEPNSTSYVWTSHYASPSGASFMKRFATRCFEDAALQVLYGACREHSRYHDFDKVGRAESAAYNTSRVAADFDLSVAVGNVGRLIDSPFTRFVWRAQPPGEREDGLHVDMGKQGNGGGFDFDFGTLYRDVDYLAPGGPDAPGGGSWKSDWVRVYDDGWIQRAALNLLTRGGS